MKYLDPQKLTAVRSKDFKKSYPFPYCVVKDALTPSGYKSLLENLPQMDVSKADEQGRLNLKYENIKNLETLPQPWREFIQELKSKKYHDFLKNLFAHPYLDVRFAWQYSQSHYVLSPHCDHPGKLGSHLFYLNTENDWKPEWGGGTVVLEPIQSGLMYDVNSDHLMKNDDFRILNASGPIGNVSMLFERTDNSWHSMEKIRSPEGSLRKVFIVVIERKTWKAHMLRKYPLLGKIYSSLKKGKNENQADKDNQY